MKKSIKRVVSLVLLVMMLASMFTISAMADVEYFAKPKIKSVSIVDSLHSIKENYSYAYRKQIAAANGIEGYRGTAQQNLYMVELLQAGKLIKPAETTPSKPTAKPGYYKPYTGKVTGLVQALAAVDAPYSFANRAKIALLNGIVDDIADYKGSYKQNAAMIELLVKGDLKAIDL